MTDYLPLIARAVDGLAKNTGDARRALYERARVALVAQLRGVEPALSEIGHHQGAAGARRGDPQGRGRSGPQGDTSRGTRSTEPRSRCDPRRRGPPTSLSFLPWTCPVDGGRPPKPTARTRILEARTTSLSREVSLGFSRCGQRGRRPRRCLRQPRNRRARRANSYAPGITVHSGRNRPRISTAPHDLRRTAFPPGRSARSGSTATAQPRAGLQFRGRTPAAAAALRAAPNRLRQRTTTKTSTMRSRREPRSYGRWAKLA